MAKLYPVSPPSLFPPLITPPRVQPPIVRPPKLTGSNYTYASPNSNYYNWYKTKWNTNRSNEYVNDLGDIILGDLFKGTKELQNTLKKYGHEDLATVPLLNRAVGLVDAVDDRFIRPFREEDNLEVASEKMLINSLETFGNSMDILSNPIKALLGAGKSGDNWNDFLRSMGWKEGEYRENYNWDTDIDNGILKFLADLGLEIISDPTSFLSIAGGLVKNSAKKGTIEASKISFKDVLDDIAVQFRHLKTEDEIIESLARFGITDDATLTKTLLRIVEENPKLLEQQAINRVNTVREALSKTEKAVYLNGNADQIEKFKALKNMLASEGNDSILNTAFYERLTRELEQLADDVNFKKFYSATKFLDTVNKVDNAMTTASLVMTPHLGASVYAGKNLINKVVKPKISQGYLQQESFKREIKAQQDIRRKTHEYTKVYKTLSKKRKTFEFFNNRFNLEEIHERLIDYVRTSPFEIRKNEATLREALEKKAEDLIFKDDKFLERIRKMAPEYRDFVSKLSKADYDALPDMAKILVDDVRTVEILEAMLRDEIARIVANVEDLAQEIIKTREEKYTKLLSILKNKVPYQTYNAIDEMFNNIAKEAEINIEDVASLKEALRLITTSNSPLRAILEQIGIVESNYAEIVDAYIKAKELRLKTQGLFKPSFKKAEYLKGLETKDLANRAEYARISTEYKAALKEGDQEKINLLREQRKAAYNKYKFSGTAKSLERYKEYDKANTAQEKAYKELRDKQALAFGEFLEKSGYITGKTFAEVQESRVNQGIKNLDAALKAEHKKQLADTFKSKTNKSIEDLRKMAAAGETFQTVQYNKTETMLRLAESAIESTEKYLPNFYGNRWNYLKDFKSYIATVNKLDSNAGKNLQQTLLNFYSSYVQTNAFLRYFMGEMNMDYIPKEYQNKFRIQLHDTIQSLSNAGKLGAGANEITDAIVTDMLDLIKVICNGDYDLLNKITNETIKPQVQRYLKELAALKKDVNKYFVGKANKVIPFYRIIDKGTIDALDRLGPVLTDAITNKFSKIDMKTKFDTLEMLTELSRLVPTIDKFTLEEAIKEEGSLVQNKTVTKLIEEINKYNNNSWLNDVREIATDITRKNNEFKRYIFNKENLPKNLEKKAARYDKLMSKSRTKTLSNAEQIELKELRNLLAPYLIPQNFYTPREIKDISGYWAQDLARNSDLGTYNFLNKKIYADELHLNKIFDKLPASETYNAIQFAHDAERYFKTIQNMDKNQLGYNQQINEYFNKLYDHMLDDAEALLENKYATTELEYFINSGSKDLSNQAKRSIMYYLEIEQPELFKGIKDHYDHVTALYKDLNAQPKAIEVQKNLLDKEIQKQADLVSFLVSYSETEGIKNAIETGDITSFYKALNEEEFVKSMDIIATGSKGVNGEILHNMKTDILKDTSKLNKSDSNKLTTKMNTAFAVGLKTLTPKELGQYIAAVNKEYNYIIVNTAYAPTEEMLNKLTKAGISITELYDNQNKLYGYLLQNTKLVEQPTQKEFNTIVGKLGKFKESPLLGTIKKYMEYIPYANTTAENALDLSGLYHFYTGHTLNRTVMDAASQSKSINKHALLNLIEEDKYIHKADFVHMIDASNYNYFVSTLLDKLNPEDINSAFRQQSYVKNVAKGLTQAVVHKDNAFKALDVFFNKDSITYKRSQLLINKLQEDEKLLKEFFEDNKSVKAVPVILIQNKNGDPELHKIFINNEKVYNQFLEKGGIFVEPEVYKFMINNINRVNATGVRKILYQVLKPMYAMAYLTSPGFLFRNFIDTLLVKNSLSSDYLSDIPDIIRSEAQAYYELNTYKKCWQEIYDATLKHAEELGKDITNIHPGPYDISKTYQTWDLPTRLTFLKLTMWKDTSAAADLSSEMLELFGKGRLDDDALARVMNRISEMPPMSWVSSINSDIEQTGRLGLYNFLTNYKGMNPNKALDEVIKTHFDYQTKDMGMEYLRDFFMFETFPVNNVLYYLDIGLNRNPEILKLLLDVEEQSWNTNGLTWDDVKDNQLLRRQVLMGNIKVGDYIIKTGSSLMDFLNVIGTPLEAIKERGNPLVRAVTQLNLRQADPFMAYPNRLRQIKKFIDTKGEKGSILPSIYSKYTEGAKNYKRSRTKSNYVRWTKYPKIRKPHKTYLRNYKFYSKPYYFKRPNTLAWATSNSRWNIRPTYKLPRGARYYTRRYIGTPDYLTKFGPEDI